MSSVLVGSVATVVTGGSALSALVVVLSGGLVGMSIREMIGILGDDEGDGGAEEDELADGGLMTEEGDEDLGGLGGIDEGGDDEFGDFGGDDEFGDMGGGGGSDTDELEHRLDELETEVGSLSSTVNTVRNENEQISETVDEVEENVRKLLDIYEMVTRGVNPFADDMEPGGMGGAGGGSFGLFDEGEETTEEESLDEDIANADAEGFFDEDLVEDDAEAVADADPMATGDDGDPGFGDDGGTFDDDALGDDGGEFDDGAGDDDGGELDDGAGDDEGGKSFAELKDEYEAGDADWADGAGEDGEEGDGDIADELGDADELLEDDEVLEDDESDGGDDLDGGLADDDLFDEVVEDTETDGAETGSADAETADPEPDTESESASGSEPEPEPDPDPEPASEGASSAGTATSETDPAAEGTTDAGAAAGAAPGSGEGSPYLAEMPDGVAADTIVVEWLEYLVGEVGVRETARALDYYERIGWVAEPVAEDLRTYLRGFDGEGGDGDLTIDHHTRSLQYISQLDGGAADALALSGLLGRGGGLDGLQR